MPQLPLRVALLAAAGIDHEIRQFAFLRIRHLARADGFELCRRHAGPPHHARLLHRFRRRHADHVIAALVATGFEQQRDFEHGGGRFSFARLV